MSTLERCDNEKIDFAEWDISEDEIETAELVCRDLLLDPPDVPMYLTLEGDGDGFKRPLTIDLHIEPFQFRTTLRALCMYELSNRISWIYTSKRRFDSEAIGMRADLVSALRDLADDLEKASVEQIEKEGRDA